MVSAEKQVGAEPVRSGRNLSWITTSTPNCEQLFLQPPSQPTSSRVAQIGLFPASAQETHICRGNEKITTCFKSRTLFITHKALAASQQRSLLSLSFIKFAFFLSLCSFVPGRNFRGSYPFLCPSRDDQDDFLPPWLTIWNTDGSLICSAHKPAKCVDNFIIVPKVKFALLLGVFITRVSQRWLIRSISHLLAQHVSSAHLHGDSSVTCSLNVCTRRTTHA